MAGRDGPSAGDTVELRCLWRKHAEIEPQATGVARIKCRECARKRGGNVIVIHHFDLASGAIVATRVYRDASELLAMQRRERANDRRSLA